MAGHQFRYVVDRKTWHCWNGRYHLADRSGFMHKVVQSFANTYQDAIHPIEKEVKNTAE